MAQIQITVDTSSGERTRGAQWALDKENTRRASLPEEEGGPLPALSMTEFLASVLEHVADRWAKQQLREEDLPGLRDEYLAADPAVRQQVKDLLSS